MSVSTKKFLTNAALVFFSLAATFALCEAEEPVFLENEGIKHNPDVVVLGFFANDFEDNLKAGGQRMLAPAGTAELMLKRMAHFTYYSDREGRLKHFENNGYKFIGPWIEA